VAWLGPSDQVDPGSVSEEWRAGPSPVASVRGIDQGGLRRLVWVMLGWKVRGRGSPVTHLGGRVSAIRAAGGDDPLARVPALRIRRLYLAASVDGVVS
jgi:hypothetical protein